ncbi:UNVERIFIED_CONTAM: hypothetical protein GTU68_021620 [Idotea baltica]|nr:hypothetical protein [Idotea baltica]
MLDGKPTTVKDESGKYALLPSIIHFGSDGEVIVGDEAKAKLVESPERTIFSVKRLMGKSYQDEIDGKYYNPVELSAQILRKLKQRVEGQLKSVVSKAVITVPAYFNDAQRQATRDAGKLAGLDVLRIVNEPTAASLAYGIDQKMKSAQTIAVYDLGGGTFDISILRLEDGIYEVLSTNGDTFLGGDDVDLAIVNNWATQGLLDKGKLATDVQLQQEVRLLAEEAKKQLSKETSFQGSLQGTELSLTRDDFDALISPLIERTISACSRAMKDAGLTKDDIDHVILVGGSTRIPFLKNRVSELFGKAVNDNLDPDQVVALGAAIQADILAGNQKEMLLLDITPLSLGIETVGGLMDVILPRNSKIPSSVGRNYTTSIDGQKNLKVSIYQGERDLVENNRKLGEFILKNIPPMAAGIPKIEISFIIDADGILKVRAKELRSETSQEIEIRSAYGISEEEMGKMLLDSLQNAQGDIAEKAIREAVNEANHIVLSTEKFLTQNGEILTADQTSKLSELKEVLKVAIESRDKNQIERSMQALNTFSEPLAHVALDHQISKSMKGKSI